MNSAFKYLTLMVCVLYIIGITQAGEAPEGRTNEVDFGYDGPDNKDAEDTNNLGIVNQVKSQQCNKPGGGGKSE